VGRTSWFAVSTLQTRTFASPFDKGAIVFKQHVFSFAAALGVSAIVVAAEPAAKAPTGKLPPSCKLDLTPNTFAKLHALIRPQQHEWRI
jgi:hypothetical protein